MRSGIRLTAELIEGFSGVYLSPRYDNPKPTPLFHRECWGLYCSEERLCAVAAPRSHAKSTALTHNYVLANVLMRCEEFILIVSATEDLAILHLGDIAEELRGNEELRKEFRVKALLTDAKTDVVVEFEDGHRAKILAKGSGQKMRGLKWNGRRPGLVICDDLEEDTHIESRDAREKFQRWFLRALKPVLRAGGSGKIRVHGTILHEDSLLAKLMKSKSWNTMLYRAHAGFDDFSEILWPQMWSEALLRSIRQDYLDNFDAGGYAQEYLNDPMDHSEAYLRESDFIAMKESDFDCKQTIAVGCDFAVSKSDKANRTSLTVGGLTTNNDMNVIDQFVGRWDALEIMNEMFLIQKRHRPSVFFVEDGVIWKTLWPMLAREMRARNSWINCHAINPTKDKATRGRALQARHRAGGIKFNKDAPWYPGYERELLRFTGHSDAIADDQFDSTALLVKGFDRMGEVMEEDFMEEDEWEMMRNNDREHKGRSMVTGY